MLAYQGTFLLRTLVASYPCVQCQYILNEWQTCWERIITWSFHSCLMTLSRLTQLCQSWPSCSGVTCIYQTWLITQKYHISSEYIISPTLTTTFWVLATQKSNSVLTYQGCTNCYSSWYHAHIFSWKILVKPPNVADSFTDVIINFSIIHCWPFNLQKKISKRFV